MRLSRSEDDSFRRRSANVVEIHAMAFALLALVSSVVSADESKFYVENFESHADGQSVLAAEEWKGFEGFRGESKPSAMVKDSVGADGSKALVISHAEPFRTDNWGVRTRLAEPINNGVVWVQGLFKLPKEWKAGLFFDMRGEKSNQVIARVATTPYTPKDSDTTEMRWHSVFNVPYWRLYTRTPRSQAWHTITVRIDFETGTYACWADSNSRPSRNAGVSGVAC